MLNLEEFRVTFSVGAERIVRKENGVTRQKIQEKFPRGEVVQRSVGITLPRLFNPIDVPAFFPIREHLFTRPTLCRVRKIARYSTLFIRRKEGRKERKGEGERKKKKKKKSNQLSFAKGINLELD